MHLPLQNVLFPEVDTSYPLLISSKQVKLAMEYWKEIKIYFKGWENFIEWKIV